MMLRSMMLLSFMWLFTTAPLWSGECTLGLGGALAV